MTWQQWVMLLLFFGTIIGLINNQKKPQQVFAVAALVCLLCAFVSVEELLSNAVNPGLVTLLLLIISALVLERTSIMRRLTASLLTGSKVFAYSKTLGITVLASAFINNTAVIAALLSPIRNNKLISPSRLLMPLSFVAIMGGTLTLVGTSTNLVVNSLLIEQQGSGFRFFDFTLIGLSALLPCLLVMAISIRLLPEGGFRKNNLGSYFLEAEIESSSLLVNRTVEENGLRNLDSLFLVEVIRGDHIISAVTPDFVLQAHDKLIFSGDVSSVLRLKQFDGLRLFAEEDNLLGENLTEALVKPNASIVGKTLKQAGFRARFDAAVVAIKREGEKLSGKLGNIKIEAGDLLVMATGRDFSSRPNISKNFFIVSGIEPENYIAGWREHLVIWGFIAALLSSIVFEISLIKTLIVYLSVSLLIGAMTAAEIQRRLPMDIFLIVVSALTLAKALDNTGLSAVVASGFEGVLSMANIYWALIAIYVFTLLLTELITNNAAAALSFPLAYSLAVGLGVDPMPFVMAVAFAASASFLSPYGYQTNLMIFNAGNYRLMDFIRFGLPISATYAVTVLWVIPKVFPF